MESSEEVRPRNQISLEADTISQSSSTERAFGEVKPKKRVSLKLELGTTSESFDDNSFLPKKRVSLELVDDNIRESIETQDGQRSSFSDRLRIKFMDVRPNIDRRNETLQRRSNPSRNMRKSFTRSIRSFPIGNAQVEDHFSIPKRSSSYSHQGKDTLLFPLSFQGAIVLENDKLDVTQPLTVKYYNDATTGFIIVRAFHTLVALLVALFVFLFSIQVILFLWIGLAIDSGLTSAQDMSFERICLFLGTICSIPYFVYGTAEIMTNATSFAIDAWSGHMFLKTFLHSNRVVVSWVSTIVYVLVPIMAMSCSLLAGSTAWWDNSLFAWFIAVFLYFIVYHVGSIYYEVIGCLEIVHYHPVTLQDKRFESDKICSMANALQCWYLIASHNLSGLAHVKYITVNEHPVALEETYEDSSNQDLFSSSIGLYSKFTLFLSKYGLFKKPLAPERMYSTNETTDVTPIINRVTWSLENVYCRNRFATHLAIIDGKGALRPSQVKSSYACFIIGSIMNFLVVIGILSWMNIHIFVIVIICGLGIIYNVQTVRQGFAIRGVIKSVQDGSENSMVDSTYLYTAFLTYRISLPSYKCCCYVTAARSFVFFLFPAFCLFKLGHVPVAIIFIILAIFVNIKWTFDISRLFQELGSLEGLEDSCTCDDEEWNKKNKYSLVGARKNTFWFRVFSFFTVLFGLILVGAFLSGKSTGREKKFQYAPGFVYPPAGDLQYPTCSLRYNFTVSSDAKTSLVDFAFLSGIAYASPDIMTEELSNWFMDENYINHKEVINSFRDEYEMNNLISAVEFIFIGFPDQDLGIVSIRGTLSLMDTLVDIQLWTGSFLSRIFRYALPGGELLTPLFLRMINIIAYIESGIIQQISFYQETTAFMQFLKEKNMYSNLALTGHSLGGGLAMITAAQTQIPAITISSPNALLSRGTFGPTPVTESGLAKYTFNVIPNRDIVPLMDDASQNFQKINCRSPMNKPHQCHLPQWAICELLYTCGSYGRPIPCYCVSQVGYDEPDPINIDGKTFSEICSE